MPDGRRPLFLLEEKDFEYITVKEICNKAGVNRSTFYLHYETMRDLLEETSQYVLKNFYLQTCEVDELYLVTPKYLEPYLSFVKNNKRLFRTTLRYYKLFGWDSTYDYMYKYIFSPILDRFGQPENVKSYLVSFYINGLIAIVNRWVLADCAESIPDLIGVIKTCMNR